MIKKLNKVSNKDIALSFLKAERNTIPIYTINSIRVALIYPNYYHIGMSNLGFQTIYALMNKIDGICCERAFLPNIISPNKSNKIITIETQTPIEKFDIIAFSISFENDVLSIIHILSKANIPLLSKSRSNDTPLIMAGGALCFLNPEPLAPFIDCFLLGEVESTLKKFFKEFNKTKNRKKNLIDISCKISNLYVPTFFQTKYTKEGTIKNFNVVEKVPNKIKRAINYNLVENPTNTIILTPNTTFSNTFLIEVSRGCHHKCRFCSAGYIYNPRRFQSKEVLKLQIEHGLKFTNKIGLVGICISDYPKIEHICNIPKFKNINFKFSSLRADNITTDIVKIFKKNNIKTATIAPDAGSERLRKIINKNITEEDILKATELLVAGGIPNLKMYFIIGLPDETDEDVEEIILLCKKVKKCFLQFSRYQKRIGRITISINPFIPKPSTPFQWTAMEKISILRKKINIIKKKLNSIANIHVQAESIKKAYTQALIARGDRNIAKILILAYKNNQNWPKTFKESHINTNFYVNRNKNFSEILPWDFIEQKIDKRILLKEYNLATNNEKPLRDNLKI